MKTHIQTGCTRADDRLGFLSAGSEASGENQNEEDDDQDAKHANAAMTEAVTIAPEATAEAPQEEDDENNQKNCTKRHDASSCGWIPTIPCLARTLQ
jgi:hypothetical protein